MSQRARLFGRARPTATYSIRVEDTTEAAAAADTAERELRLATLRDGEDSPAAEQARAAHDAAQERLAACYETLHITALPPAEFEELVAAHPPTDEQRQQGWVWNEDTFRPALFAGCIAGDMTEDDWTELTTKGPMSVGEVRALWASVLSVNDRTPDSRIPKG